MLMSKKHITFFSLLFAFAMPCRIFARTVYTIPNMTYYFSNSNTFESKSIIIIFILSMVIHIISCLSFAYFYQEKLHSRLFLFCIIFIVGCYINIHCLGLFLLTIFECLFLKWYIDICKKYRRFITRNEETQLRFEEQFNAREKYVLQDYNKSNPSFSVDDFKSRINKAFFLVKNSWVNQNLTEVEHFLADGLYEQFRIRINNLVEKEKANIIKNIKVVNTKIIKVYSSPNYDFVYVSILYKAINFILNMKTESVSKGSGNEEGVFNEIWCFARKKDAIELFNKGLIEGFCPKCGKRIENTSLISCPYCNTNLHSGSYDWVLTSICEASDWKSRRIDYVPCMDFLMVQDPYFNLQNIEDKISVVFWRLIEAIKRKISTPILKLSSYEFANDFTKNKFMHPEFTHYDDAEIDSIEVLNIGKNNNKLILLTQIIWKGYLPKNSESRLHKRTIFVLQRGENVKSDIDKNFCNSHCFNCGAPETYNGSNLCENCNTTVNDDEKGWILIDIYNANNIKAQDFYSSKITAYETETLNNPQILETQNLSENQDAGSKVINKELPKIKKFSRANALLKKQEEERKAAEISKAVENASSEIDWLALGQYSSKDLLRLSIAVMLADGIVDARELEILRKICKYGFIYEDELQKNIFEMQGMIDPVNYALDTTSINLDINLMLVLIKIAASDGKIADSELKLLNKVAERMGMPEKDFRDLVNQVYENNWKK